MAETSRLEAPHNTGAVIIVNATENRSSVRHVVVEAKTVPVHFRAGGRMDV